MSGQCVSCSCGNKKPTFTVGVFGVIFDKEKRVLLVHRRDCDLWDLPGGGMEHGETPWDAIVREVREETGLTVTVDRLVGVYGKRDANELIFSFICTIVNGKSTLTDEADRIEYFAFEELPANTSSRKVIRIKDALEGKVAVLREQAGPSTDELIKQGKL